MRKLRQSNTAINITEETPENNVSLNDDDNDNANIPNNSINHVLPKSLVPPPPLKAPTMDTPPPFILHSKNSNTPNIPKVLPDNDGIPLAPSLAPPLVPHLQGNDQTLIHKQDYLRGIFCNKSKRVRPGLVPDTLALL